MDKVGRLDSAAPVVDAAAALPVLHSRLVSGYDVLDSLDGAIQRVWDDAPTAGLFQHPAWARSWWATFGGSHASPCVWEGVDGRGALKAYALWTIETRPAFGRNFRRLQPLGSSIWTQDAFPSEHPSVVSLGGPRANFMASCTALDTLLELQWDDIVVPYVCLGSALDVALRRWAAKNRLPWVSSAQGRSHAIMTSGSFESYRASLSSNARRAAFAKRRSAAEHGITFATHGESRECGLRLLFELHEARWSGNGMPDRGRKFLEQVSRYNSPGLKFEVSLLMRNGRAVSASLSAYAKRRVYNLQGGFLPKELASFSLGKLHLGFDIERCFALPEVDALDLLAGPGKREEYKAAFASQSVDVYSFRAARTGWGRAALAMRRWINRGRSSITGG